MRTCFVVAVVALALGSAPPPKPRPDGKAKADLAKMQGLWLMEEYKDGSGIRMGPTGTGPAPPIYVAILGDRLEVPWDSAFALRLDPTAKPKRLTIRGVTGEAKGKSHRGIYKLDGDTLTICTETAGSGWPESFEPRAPGAVLEVYKRVSLDDVRRLREDEQKAGYRWLGPPRRWLTAPAGR